MTTVSVTQARKDIYNLVEEALGGVAVTITSKDGNAVLMNEADWSAIKETLYLMSVPDMTESLEEAERTEASECISWDSLKDIV